MGMDNENISDLKSLCPEDWKAKIELLGNHDPNGEKIIRDPYYVRIKIYMCNVK